MSSLTPGAGRIFLERWSIANATGFQNGRHGRTLACVPLNDALTPTQDWCFKANLGAGKISTDKPTIAETAAS